MGRPRLNAIRDRIDPRARRGLLLVSIVYLLGWTLGRAAGKIEVLERLNAPRSARS
jgi:hypothetical protein